MAEHDEAQRNRFAVLVQENRELWLTLASIDAFAMTRRLDLLSEIGGAARI